MFHRNKNIPNDNNTNDINNCVNNDNINEYEDVLIVNRYQSIGDEMENYNMDDLDNS